MGTAITTKYSSFKNNNIGVIHRKGESPKPINESYAFVYSACGYYGADSSKLAIWSPESQNGTTIRKSRVQLFTKISDKYPSMNDKLNIDPGKQYSEDSDTYITKVLDIYSYPSFKGAKTITIKLLDTSVISKYGVRIIDPSKDDNINIHSGQNGAWITDSEFTVDLTSLPDYSEDTRYYLGLTMAKDDQKSDISNITLGKDIDILIDNVEFNADFNGQLDYDDV